MFDMNISQEAARAQLKIVRIYDEIERRLVAQFGGVAEIPVLNPDGSPMRGKDGDATQRLVERGWIDVFLPQRQAWPLLTIEPFKDEAKSDGNGIGKMRTQTINVRCTLEMRTGQPCDPDTLLRLALLHLRRAMFPAEERAQRHLLNTPAGETLLTQPLSEAMPAQFVPAEPGLPFGSVHLQLTLSYRDD